MFFLLLFQVNAFNIFYCSISQSHIYEYIACKDATTLQSLRNLFTTQIYPILKSSVNMRASIFFYQKGDYQLFLTAVFFLKTLLYIDL